MSDHFTTATEGASANSRGVCQLLSEVGRPLLRTENPFLQRVTSWKEAGLPPCHGPGVPGRGLREETPNRACLVSQGPRRCALTQGWTRGCRAAMSCWRTALPT